VSRRPVDRRIRLLLVVLLLAFAASLGRAVWLQAVRAAPLAELGQRQHRQSVEVPARRGTIYDRGGVELALGERAMTVYADPRQVRDPRRVAAEAARILGVDSAALLAGLADRTKHFVYVQRKADPARAARLLRLGLAGVDAYPEERRVYPQASIAAHVLGYAGVDNRGLAGLESRLDSVLRGTPGKRTFVKDPTGRALEVVSTQPERDGRDVFLTIDHTLQAQAQEVLAEAVRHWRAKGASAVVLDSRTGEVLAMAVAPAFDANTFGRVPSTRSRNRAVTDTYEPGSTLKLVTVAGALSEGLVSPRSPFMLAPSIRVADRVIHEAHERPTQRMTVAEIMSQSSNVGTVTLAKMLGTQRLSAWVARFGLGRTTGIEFPGETGGIVPPLERWSGSTIGTLPIGHGIAVTAVQMAAAYAAIANGGLWVQPHLVDRVVGGKTTVPEKRRVVSRGVARTLVSMLEGVVDDRLGTGTLAAVPGYNVAGKTGTAAKPDPRGGYSDSRYVASFVGMLPVSDPRLVISVTVDEPRGAIWGGVVAAPAFQRIARFGVQHLDLAPDAQVEGDTSQ
jgi:cell division protein FtsI (penicillin-binding protein 3)